MTELLEKAMKAAKELPPEDQDAVAGAVLDFLQRRHQSILTDEQLAEVHRRLNDPDSQYESLAEVRRRLSGAEA